MAERSDYDRKMTQGCKNLSHDFADLENISVSTDLIQLSGAGVRSDYSNPECTHAESCGPASMKHGGQFSTDDGRSCISQGRISYNSKPYADDDVVTVSTNQCNEIDKSNNQSIADIHSSDQSVLETGRTHEPYVGITHTVSDENPKGNGDCMEKFDLIESDIINNQVEIQERQCPNALLEESTHLDFHNEQSIVPIRDETENCEHVCASSSGCSVLSCISENKQSSYNSIGAFTFEIDFNSLQTPEETPEKPEQMPKKIKNSLQDAFLNFRKKRQDEIRAERKRRDAILEANADPMRMSRLRERIITQAKRYFGVPYAKKYWQPNTLEYNSPIFLDCCGLVRQIIRDLQDDLGFRLGPWNQAYMFDTLPVTLTKKQMKPGDLVFMTGEYTNAKKKKQRHNMLHVEIWLGEGNKTIGSRWNNGKVGVFESYKFDPKSFHNEQYIFKSIDTWLMGICHSYCHKHPWRIRKPNPSAKSIFHADDVAEDEKANPDSDDEGDKEGNTGGSNGATPVIDQQEGSDGDGDGGGGGIEDPLVLQDMSVDASPNLSGQSTPAKTQGEGTATKNLRPMISPKTFKVNLRNTIRVSGASSKPRNSGVGNSGDAIGDKKPQNSSRATFGMDHDATKLSNTPKIGASNVGSSKQSVGGVGTSIGDLKLLREAAKSRRTTASATIVTSVVSRPVDTVAKEEDETKRRNGVLLEASEETMDYIPNRLPSRSGSRMSNAWRTSKERERQARLHKSTGDHNGPTKSLEAWVAPLSKKANNMQKNKQHKEKQHRTVLATETTSPLLEATQKPNAVLQSSETNLLFRSNTNFFQNAADTLENSVQVVKDSDRLGQLQRIIDKNDKEKITWRLSTRVSPERGCGPRNEALEINKIDDGMVGINDEGVSNECFEYLSDEIFDENLLLDQHQDITSCLIVKPSPRKAPPAIEDNKNNGLKSDNICNRNTGNSRGNGKKGIRKGFSSRNPGEKVKIGTPYQQNSRTMNVGVGQNAGRGVGRVQYLSTAILQSAICPRSSKDLSNDNKSLNQISQLSSLPPVDDNSVVVWAGTASQASHGTSSSIGSKSLPTSMGSVSEKSVNWSKDNLKDPSSRSPVSEKIVNQSKDNLNNPGMEGGSLNPPQENDIGRKEHSGCSVSQLTSTSKNGVNKIIENKNNVTQNTDESVKLDTFRKARSPESKVCGGTPEQNHVSDIQTTVPIYSELQESSTKVPHSHSHSDTSVETFRLHAGKNNFDKEISRSIINLEQSCFLTDQELKSESQHPSRETSLIHDVTDIDLPIIDPDESDIINTSFTSDLSSIDLAFTTWINQPIHDGSGDGPGQTYQNIKHSNTSNMEKCTAGDDKNIIDKSPLSDLDTDDELESAVALTNFHKYYDHETDLHSKSSYQANMNRIDSIDINNGRSVEGILQEGLQADIHQNPAWEWLYSFKGGNLASAMGTENTNNSSSNYCDINGRTNVFPGHEDVDSLVESISAPQNSPNTTLRRRHNSSAAVVLPSLTAANRTDERINQNNYFATSQCPAYPKRPLNVLESNGSSTGDLQLRTRLEMLDSPEYSSSKLLASYVLNQEPKGVNDYGVDYDDDEGCDGLYAADDVSDSVDLSALQDVLDAEPDSTNDTINPVGHRSAGEGCVSDNTYDMTPTSDVDSIPDCCSVISDRIRSASSRSSGNTIINFEDHIKKTFEENNATILEWIISEMPDKESFSEKGLYHLDSSLLTRITQEAKAADYPCNGVNDDNNNSGTTGYPLNKRRAENRTVRKKKPVGRKDEKLPNPSFDKGRQYFDLQTGKTRQGACVETPDIGDDTGKKGKFNKCRSFDSLSNALGYQRKLLNDTFPHVKLSTPQELSFWSNPAAPQWRLSRVLRGASAKSHTGRQATGGSGAGATGQPSGSGEKGATEKAPASDTTEGGGDDGTKGGNKGGGGGRRPSRPPKLPQCCLPNNMQPTFYIGGGNGTALVEAPLLSLGWKRITDKNDERYRLKWVENKSRINYVAFREGEQLVNHIPNCKLLTNKLGLVCSLQEYERVTLLTKGRTPRMKMSDFVPETYKLDERNDREKFLEIYADGETWICKPTSLNQGKGIFLLRSREEINNLLSERDAKQQTKSISRQPLMRIVQRYLNKPLLLDNRKFDIRAYMLIASTVPYLVLFHHGYVRLSCQKYDVDDTNLTTHLTNQFVQKKDPSYKDNKEDTAWTMEKFNDYINENIAKEKGLETDWVFGGLAKQMQRISLHCFNSVKHKLQCKIGYFDLYGLDFMIDENMKTWLIEVNANPALHTNCQALKEAIPPVVESGIYVAVECFDKSRKGQPLMPVNSLAGYTVLYCGASPNAAAPRQIRSVSPFKDAGEWASRPAGQRFQYFREVVKRTATSFALFHIVAQFVCFFSAGYSIEIW